MKSPVIVVRRSTLAAAREGEPPRPFLPFVVVRRSSFHALTLRLWRAELKVSDQQRALSRLGRRRVEEKAELARMLTDLRILRVHLDLPSGGSYVGFSVQMPEAVYDGYRGQPLFTEVVAQYVKHAMMLEPEGRKVLAGRAGFGEVL